MSRAQQLAGFSGVNRAQHDFKDRPSMNRPPHPRKSDMKEYSYIDPMAREFYIGLAHLRQFGAVPRNPIVDFIEFTALNGLLMPKM
jgi:hypothetical protein